MSLIQLDHVKSNTDTPQTHVKFQIPKISFQFVDTQLYDASSIIVYNYFYSLYPNSSCSYPLPINDIIYQCGSMTFTLNLEDIEFTVVTNALPNDYVHSNIHLVIRCLSLFMLNNKIIQFNPQGMKNLLDINLMMKLPSIYFPKIVSLWDIKVPKRINYSDCLIELQFNILPLYINLTDLLNVIFWVIHFVQLIVQRSRNDHIRKPKEAIYGPKEMEEEEEIVGIEGIENLEKSPNKEKLSSPPIMSYRQLFLDGVVPFSLHFTLGKLIVQFNPYLFVETPTILITNFDKKKTLCDLLVKTKDLLIYSNSNSDGIIMKRNIFEGGNFDGELSLDIKKKMIIKSNVKISKITLDIYPDTVLNIILLLCCYYIIVTNDFFY